ncbi:MAG: hypothetical protein ACYDHN_14205 [Solirubrobacteraceae bacterium]
MQSTLSPTLTAPRTSTSRRLKDGHRLTARTTQSLQSSIVGRRSRRLASYTDHAGQLREVISQQGAAGTMLVLDRDPGAAGDVRLLAHLSADEPPENAALVCSHYLLDTRERGRRCRAMTPEDLCRAPIDDALVSTTSSKREGSLIDAGGSVYVLRRVDAHTSIPHLRWCRREGTCAEPGPLGPVSLRDVVAALESYEPALALTHSALALHREDPAVSTAVLAAELVRIQESPIVLNRKLREAVLAAMEREQLSMSEIATRCGRVKRDSKGNESGETSWLARRLGLLPDGATHRSTPWIHNEVLALIARRGLGLSPREVEA